MNRNEEYQALLAELETVPPALETTVDRAVKRETASRRRRRVLGIPVGSLAACFTVFVLLVNLFPPFAAACGNVPLLRQLAKAVAWSPSLSAAVDNEFVQPMGLSQTENGITATIQYLIVDQKQVNLFFTLEGEGYESLSAEMPAFSPEQVCAVMGADFQKPPGTLLRFSLDYVDQDVPEGFTMTFDVTGEREAEEEPTTAPDRAYEEELLAPGPEAEPEILASFAFDLRFEPDFTAAGEVIPVHETFLLDGQTLTVTEAELYPTHLRLNVTGDPANTAWLKDLDFYLENEDGERFGAVSGGITASGDPDSPAMASFRLESPYFSRSDHLTLFITGARWLDKGRERVYVDLEHGTAPWLPEGVTLTSAQRRAGGWLLTFRLESGLSSPFSMTFHDAEGNDWEMGCMGMTVTDEPGIYETDKIGIRIENELLCKEAMETEYGKFYCFEPITYCPIDRKAIDPKKLSPAELSWLNQYHSTVYETLSPYLTNSENEWLKKACAPIA